MMSAAEKKENFGEIWKEKKKDANSWITEILGYSEAISKVNSTKLEEVSTQKSAYFK